MQAVPGETREEPTATAGPTPAPAPAVDAAREQPPIEAPSRVRGVHQAIVVIERRFGRQGDARTEQMVPGWQWTLGNTRVGELYDQGFAEAQLTWSSLVVPEEQQATFASLKPPVASKEPLLTYNGTMQIAKAALPSPMPDDDELMFLIFNGHCFPICDLNAAMVVHRQNRCDVTLIDFPRARRQSAYDERVQVDDDGRVQRVNREYNRTDDSMEIERDWPALFILSGVAMNALLDVSLPKRINQWPAAMIRAGLLVRASTISGRSFSLHDRAHLYELNEAILRLKPHWLADAGRLVDQGQKIWVGNNVKIDSRANLIGPVALGDDVEIGADAVIVGPTTIGRGCKIGAGVILKRSVVLPNTTLAAATLKSHSLSQAVVVGADQPTLQVMVAPTPAQTPQPGLHSMPVHRPIRLETVLEAGGVPALNGFRYRWFCFVKRAMDIVGAIVGLTLTLPFYPLIAIAIFLNSPGPIIYAQARQGRGGKNFKCLKFRTMVTNADEIKRKLMLKNEVDGPQFKIKDDPRVFFVGRWLRRLNLDEVPQFWNVLMGQMSLVGPRPSPERENQICPAWREARLSVRPGITGLWQVKRCRDRESDFQEWIYYDVQYIKKQSIWLDIKILLKTFLVALKGGH